MPETRYHPVRRYPPPLLLFLFYLSACIFIFILHEKGWWMSASSWTCGAMWSSSAATSAR